MTYDTAGNLRKKSPLLPAATYLQDADGAITEIERLSTTLTLERNADGQIRSIQKTHTEEMGCFYDLSGERIEKRRPIMGLTLEGRYAVDASYEVDTVAETHQVHLFVGARRVATSKRPGLGTSNGPVVTAADAVEFYHPDHVGSNTLVTDAQGQRVQDSYLTPFGELHALADGSGVPVSPSDSTTRHLFTDQEHDAETGLHYFGARLPGPLERQVPQPGPGADRGERGSDIPTHPSIPGADVPRPLESAP